MNKYRGRIAYAYHEETSPGIFEEFTQVRYRRGDVQEERRSLAYREFVNGERSMNLKLSIVADKFDFAHFSDMVWAELYGKKWVVESAVPASPRINITLGGLYHENTEEEDNTDAE